MDDVPSRAAERSDSERTASARGIFDVGSRFVPIYGEIARGAKDAMGKRWDRDEWWDLVQTLADDALEMYRSNPECFANGTARHWASRAASHRIQNRERDAKRRVIRDLAIEQWALTNLGAKAIDEEIEEQERARDVHKALGVIKPNRGKALIARFFRGRSYREAAAEAGTSERAERRAVDKGLRDLALELSHLDPRASHDATKRGDHA